MIRHLHDAADASLGAFRDVGDHAALERAGLFAVEGRLIVQRLLEDQRYNVHSVVVTPAASAALAATFEQRPGVDVFVCDPATLHEVTGFHFHRGCLALAWRELPAPVSTAIERARCLLALEGIGNPDNVGGLFRSALAFGVDAVLLDPATADPLYRKSIRTSMGATLRVPYWRTTGWIGELMSLRAAGWRLIALTPHPDAIPVHDLRIDSSARHVILAGAEGPGLSDDAMAQADAKVRIPMDPRADSLNVVVAAAIALNALNGQRATGK